MGLAASQFMSAVGRIRVLETRLLNRNEVDRMIGAKDAKEAYRVLNELDYSNHLGDIDNLESFQEVINAGLKDSKEIMIKMCPTNWPFNYIWYRYDIHNIKTLLKGKLAKKDFEKEVEPNLMELGAINLDTLKRYIIEGENEKFNLDNPKHEEQIKLAIEEAIKIYEKNESPQIIDIILDRTLLKIIHDIAKKTGSKFLMDFTSINIDINNISALIRVKLQEKDADFLEKIMVEGGYIKTKELRELFSESLDSIIQSLKFSPYSAVVQKGITYYQENNALIELEKLFDDYRIDFIKKAKLIPFGLEPLIAFFWAKKNNAQIIRMIMIAKLNNLPNEEINSRLRELYI